MKSLLKRFEVLTIEQELFWLLLLSGLILLGVVSWTGYHLYQARPCGCVPGDDNSEKLLPGEKVVGERLVSPKVVGSMTISIQSATVGPLGPSQCIAATQKTLIKQNTIMMVY